MGDEARSCTRAGAAWRTRGWFSPLQFSTDVACCGGLLLSRFPRPVAGRRPCLASSHRSPLRAERGSGTRGATGDMCATHAARVQRGWFSPPQSSRAFPRCGGLLLSLFSCPVGRSARAAPSLHPRCGGGRLNVIMRNQGREGASNNKNTTPGVEMEGGGGWGLSGWGERLPVVVSGLVLLVETSGARFGQQARARLPTLTLTHKFATGTLLSSPAPRLSSIAVVV